MRENCRFRKVHLFRHVFLQTAQQIICLYIVISTLRRIDAYCVCTVLLSIDHTENFYISSVPPARPFFNALKSYESPYFSSFLTICARTSGRGELRLDQDLILPLCSCDSHLPLPVIKYNQHLSFCCQAGLTHFCSQPRVDISRTAAFCFYPFFKATR